MSIPDHLLDEIWDGLLDAARLNRIYDKLAKFCGLAHLVIRLLLALSAVGCLGVIVDWWAPVTGFGVAVSVVLLTVTAVDMVMDLSKKRVILGDIALGQARLERDWQRLNGEAERLSYDEARQRTDELLARHERLDKRAHHAGVITFEFLNERCAEVAYKIHAPNAYDSKGRLLSA